jgi:hypothetical protein
MSRPLYITSVSRPGVLSLVGTTDPVRALGQLDAALEQAEPGDVVELVVSYDGTLTVLCTYQGGTACVSSLTAAYDAMLSVGLRRAS